MYSKNDALTHSRRFLDLVRRSGITIKGAFLFGSCARDEAHEESDIDIAVISPDFSGFRFDDLGKIALCKLQSNVDLDVIPFSEKNFSISDPLVREIVETGVKIV